MDTAKSNKFFVIPVVILSLVIGLNTFAKNNMGNEHRNAVSNVANELNKIATKDRGIGKELREVAKEQNESKEKAVEAIEKIGKRNQLKTFFIGTDYKNLGALRSAMVTIDNHIARLMKARNRVVSGTNATSLDKQIEALQAERSKIESFIKTNEDRFSLFGWFMKSLDQD